QRVAAPDGRQITPAEWLLDVLYRPAVASACRTFEIVHPDVLALFNLAPADGAGGKRFSYDQLAPGFGELDRQAKLADSVDNGVRSAFQRAVVQLRDNLILYQHLQLSLIAPGDAPPPAAAGATVPSPDGATGMLQQLANFETLVGAARAKSPTDPDAARTVSELSNVFASMAAIGYLLPIPPVTDPADPHHWQTAGASLRDSLATGHLNPAMAAYVDIGLAWRSYQPAAFNAAVHRYRADLDRAIPALMAKCDLEARFNAAQPFYTSMVLYVAAFLLAVVSWLKWPDSLGRAAFWVVALACVLTTAGIAARMWLEGRPPVTNLYSSALFVGWAAVALCVVLEWFNRNAIGSAAAGLIGFATLLIAHHLALGGDTMEMMRAVLDSNFWLATHVVTVTVGYSATFLAGFLALIYVFRGLLTRSLDPRTADSLTRMVYGVVCFATLFSFVGTVLGGIWADQSWGRFWGWDPKENGALIIVLWNSLILHAKAGDLVKARGLMVLAIFGNIVTSWSWFGVNMLGVGLHSYGFMAAASITRTCEATKASSHQKAASMKP
ncbi:MAG TPA: cytochrome c biogenesis protein CcsA, partial [Opitutus sp.]|nr:cytochrome c biogenesis protein CcsA [Opitutus sp.]